MSHVSWDSLPSSSVLALRFVCCTLGSSRRGKKGTMKKVSSLWNPTYPLSGIGWLGLLRHKVSRALLLWRWAAARAYVWPHLGHGGSGSPPHLRDFATTRRRWWHRARKALFIGAALLSFSKPGASQLSRKSFYWQLYHKLLVMRRFSFCWIAFVLFSLASTTTAFVAASRSTQRGISNEQSFLIRRLADKNGNEDKVNYKKSKEKRIEDMLEIERLVAESNRTTLQGFLRLPPRPFGQSLGLVYY